jgi:uncharacterized membrane protein
VGATWLTQCGNSAKSVYSDILSWYVFDYAGVPNGVLFSLGNPLMKGSYVYLLGYNTLDGVAFTNYGLTTSINASQIVPNLNETDLVFSSGSCEIYSVP